MAYIITSLRRRSKVGPPIITNDEMIQERERNPMKNIKNLSLCKALTGVIAFSLAFAVFAGPVFAADVYPSKLLRLIIPFAPGGTTDLQGRLIATALSKRLGQPVVVENKSGAGSVMGTETVAKAAPDGYTLLLVDSSYTTQPALQKLPYDSLKDFARIALLSRTESALVVHPSVPVNSVRELIALAKQKPGQLIFGTAGMGSSSHFSTELFRMLADIDIIIAHFKGGGPAQIDLLGGHSHAKLDSLFESKPHIDSGKLKVLGMSGVKRSVVMPDVPTIAEAGVPGYEYNSYRGILAPAATPAPIIDRLTKELKAILTSDDVKQQLLSRGSEADYRGPAEYTELAVKQMALWADVAKKANITMMGK
jgi:tripartite-type tricarboxylate transporter receptor subunit TctC